MLKSNYRLLNQSCFYGPQKCTTQKKMKKKKHSPADSPLAPLPLPLLALLQLHAVLLGPLPVELGVPQQRTEARDPVRRRGIPQALHFLRGRRSGESNAKESR